MFINDNCKALTAKVVNQLRALADSIERGDQLIDAFTIEEREKYSSKSYSVIESEIAVKTIKMENR